MEKLTIQKAVEIYKAFNKNFYWLDRMVKEKLINKAEAGYIVLIHG